MDGAGIPSASVLLSVRVRTVINDLRPPSLRRLSWESRVPLPVGPSPIVRPLFSRLGPSLSPRVTKLALLGRASLLFLFFPFVFTLTFRASHLSILPWAASAIGGLIRLGLGRRCALGL